MARTPKKNGHDHAFAILDDSGRELANDVTHAHGNTVMEGSLGTRMHPHKWFMTWDEKRQAFKFEFGPGGDDSHSHPPLFLKRKDF